MRCKIQGYSQAAHIGGLKEGKGTGKKVDDSLCFPLCCDRPDVQGCHSKHDQYLDEDFWIENRERAIQADLYNHFLNNEDHIIKLFILRF